jgi:hypothetical protein
MFRVLKVYQTAAGPIHPPDPDKTGSSCQDRAADSYESELCDIRAGRTTALPGARLRQHDFFQSENPRE